MSTLLIRRPSQIIGTFFAAEFFLGSGLADDVGFEFVHFLKNLVRICAVAIGRLHLITLTTKDRLTAKIRISSHTCEGIE